MFFQNDIFENDEISYEKSFCEQYRLNQFICLKNYLVFSILLNMQYPSNDIPYHRVTYQYSLIKFLRLSELNVCYFKQQKFISRSQVQFQRKLKNLEIFASIDEKSIKRYFTLYYYRKNRLLTNFVRNIFNLTTISK